MTQEKKQTAVEFYAEQDTMLNIAFFQDKDKISYLAFLKAKRELLDKALAMERVQIMQSYSDGLGNGAHHERGDAAESVLDEKRYYQRTYGKEAGDANG